MIKNPEIGVFTIMPFHEKAYVIQFDEGYYLSEIGFNHIGARWTLVITKDLDFVGCYKNILQANRTLDIVKSFETYGNYQVEVK